MESEQSSNSMRTVFISYSSKDRPFAQKLAKDIKQMGIGVWFDQWEIKVGDSIINKISTGLHENDFLAIVLSPDSVNSEWVKKELNTILYREINNQKVAVLPILHRVCEIPMFLQDKKYADFTESYETGLKELLAAISPSYFNDETNLSLQLSNYYIQQAIDLEQIGNAREALACYERAIKICPENPTAYYHFGVFKSAIGENQGAKELFLTAIKRNPEYISALLNLGGISLEDDPKSSIIYFEKAIKLGSKNYLCYQHLGQAYLATGESVKAIDSFLAAASLSQNLEEFAAAMFLIAFAYKHLNEHGAHLAYDEEFVLTKEKTGKQVTFDEYQELIDGFIRIQHINKAVEYFQKAATAFSGDERIKPLESKVNSFWRSLKQLDEQTKERGQIGVKDIVTGERVKYEACRSDLLHAKPTYSSILEDSETGEATFLGMPFGDLARGLTPPKFVNRTIADRAVLTQKNKLDFTEVKRMFQFFTGLKAEGDIHKEPSLDKDVYRIRIQDGVAICTKKDEGWIIVNYDQQGTPLRMWTNINEDATQTGALLINSFIQIDRKSTNPVFNKAFKDMKKDIERKYYHSALGAIILHTRPHPIGTEGVIEVPGENIILRYLWERATGSIKPENIQELSSLPF